MIIKFKKTQNILIAAIEGEIDHHSAETILRELDNRFSESGAKNLIFDFKGLKFMDSSGLGIIIGRYKTVSALGGRTGICAPTDSVKRLITLAGIHKIIPLFSSIDDAVDEMKNA